MIVVRNIKLSRASLFGRKRSGRTWRTKLLCWRICREHKHKWWGLRNENGRQKKKALEAEKRKLEYDIYDLLQVNFAIKDKLKRIRDTCDEWWMWCRCTVRKFVIWPKYNLYCTLSFFRNGGENSGFCIHRCTRPFYCKKYPSVLYQVYITSKLKALAQMPKKKKTDTNRLNIGQSPRKPPDSLVVKIPNNRE